VLNPNALMLNVLFGSIGVGYFVYGKKQAHLVALAAGVLLMVVPYFISNNYLMSAVCVLIMLMPKFIHL
jgi:VIT1/CCC1 family predicted Fe2+/Mn2+ transporter